MNKKRVEALIPIAEEALRVVGIAQQNENGNYVISKTFRGQISSFGAAVTMSTLRAAVAVYSQNGDASVQRQLLLKAIDYCLCNGEREPRQAAEVFAWVCQSTQNERELTARFTEAAVALKLAMNRFELVEREED